MSRPVDFVEESKPNPFKNHSGPKGFDNPGSRSKFSPNQLVERFRIHAIALTTGSPNMREIIEYWKEKFNITITAESEREWRESNIAEIEKKKSELVESGDLVIPVISEEVLSDSMMNLVITNAKSARGIKKQLEAILRKINLDKAGKDDLVDNTNNELMKIYAILDKSLFNVHANITDELKHLFMFSSKMKVKDKHITQLVESKLDKRLALLQEGSDEYTPLTEITDEVRQQMASEEE